MNNNIKNVNIVFNRDYFMEQTGVFVTHTFFDIIQLEFNRSKLSPKAFCNYWYAHNSDIFQTIQFTGKIKFVIEDDSISDLGGEIDLDNLTTMDLIENLSREIKRSDDNFCNLWDKFKERIG
jgi:hypothetical protein